MFQVSISTFQYICSLVAEEITTKPPPSLETIVGRLIPVSKQVALSLRKVATSDIYMFVEELFGVADSMTVKICKRFIKALVKCAMPLHLQ